MSLEHAYLVDVQRAVKGSFADLVTAVTLASDRFERYPQLRICLDPACEYPDAAEFMLHEFATQHGLALAPTAVDDFDDYELAVHPGVIDIPDNDTPIES